jgi:nucleotide-binding universal stress UspA family protein
MYKHILIPTDGSELSLKAVEHGISLAKTTGAKVTSITVVSPVLLFNLDPGQFKEPSEEWGYKPELEKFANKCLDQVKSVALEKGVTCNVMYVEHDQPYQAIIDAAENERCDLICMASHGRGGLAAVVLGSQTVKVLTHSKIPVLVCR